MNFNLVPLLIILLSLTLVGIGAWILIRQRWFIQWLKGTVGLLFILFAVYMSFFAFSLIGYHELRVEETVATVSFRKIAPRTFQATVSLPGGDKHSYRLRGDLWQISARIIQWDGLLSLLGLSPAYQLGRISGRYISLAAERTKEHTVYALHRETFGFDLWESAQQGWSPFIDARYGSATYLPMADGAIYEITLSSTGLVGRPLNARAERAMGAWD